MTDYNASNFVLATADICPHGDSSSLCVWCGYRAQVEHLKRERDELLKASKYWSTQLGASMRDFSECQKERDRYMEALDFYARLGVPKGATPCIDFEPDFLARDPYWQDQGKIARCALKERE